MTDIIEIGGLRLRFLQTKEDNGGSLDAFEMIVQPNARAPVPSLSRKLGRDDRRADGRDDLANRRQGLPSQSVFIGRGIVHSFRNDTPEAASCLCILTPGVPWNRLRRDGRAPLQRRPNPAKMKETIAPYGLVPAPGA